MIRIFRVYWFFSITALRLYIHFKFLHHRLSIDEESQASARIWRRIGTKASVLFSGLGGIYIKLGQFLGNAAHLFPDEFLEPLQGLQDKVPPRKYSVIQKRFYKEWNASPYEIFDSFDPSPIASASTAQVHRAVYKGRNVAVKLLYPGIEDSVRRDMKTIFRILHWIHRLILPIPYEEIHKQMDEMFTEEMNLEMELKNMEKMRYLFRKDSSILIPRVEKDLSTQGILVTEFIQGKKWVLAPIVRSKGEPMSPYAEILIQAYMKMIFHFRFFHADPHPGNIYVTEDGRVCLLDFGAVGRILEEDEDALIGILHSAMEGRSEGILEGLDRMNVLSDSIDREEILAIIDYSIRRIRSIVGSLETFRSIQLDSEGLRQDLAFIKKMKTGLRDLVRALNLPANYISLQRTADLLIGNIAWIDPYRSIFEYSEKPFRELVLRENVFSWRVLPSKD